MVGASLRRSILCREMFDVSKKRIFCDATIKAGDRCFPCHKLVLSAASPLLRDVILANSGPDFSNIDLQMDFLNSTDVACLMEYLYTGDLPEIDSLSYETIQVFTNEKYAGLSMDEAQYILSAVSSQSLCIDATSESHVISTVEANMLEEINGRTSPSNSRIVCHIETNRPDEFADVADLNCDKDESAIIKGDDVTSSHQKCLTVALDDDDQQSADAATITQHDNDIDECNNADFHCSMDVDKQSTNGKCLTGVNTPYVRPNLKLPRRPPFLCPCQNCGKIFESHQRLRSHYRHTHGEKMYKCDLCPLRFLYPKDLKNHKRTHTGEKPFICEICGKRFAQMGSLKTHGKVHLKVAEKAIFRPCRECAKKYCLKDRDKNADNLGHSDTDLSSCICPNSNCAKKFSAVKCLKKHLRNDVCNQSKFHCGICLEKFDNNIQVRYHVGTFHCTHKKRKKVKPEVKELASDSYSAPNEIAAQLLSGFEHDVDLSIMSCNVEEVTGLLQLSEEVVISGDG